MTSILVLPEQLQAEMEILACREYPQKSCGLLLGAGFVEEDIDHD